MQRARDPGAAQREHIRVLPPQRHQARHLVLRQPDLITAELGQAQIGNGKIDTSAAL